VVPWIPQFSGECKLKFYIYLYYITPQKSKKGILALVMNQIGGNPTGSFESGTRLHGTRLLHLQAKCDDLRREAARQQDNIDDVKTECEGLRKYNQALQRVITAERGRQARLLINIQEALAEFHQHDVADES
jgi:hypothetical protein